MKKFTQNFTSTLSRLSKHYSTKTCSPELNKTLKEVDPELFGIIELEKKRQRVGIQLIPSENYVSRPVLEAVGSIMTNKYSEGYPGRRYYGGNQYIDMSESLCQKRALEAFKLNPEEWGVNVQSLSGSPANFQAYSAIIEPHDRILSMDLPHGGHLSHGYQIPQKKISMVSKFFETLPYRLDETTGLIDYEKMGELADLYRPKIIIAGASAYSRNINYKLMKEIAERNNSYLLSDMAHISGLVAAGVVPTPFEHSDIVTTTTHKSLRGPRGAMIFFRKGKKIIKKGKDTVEVEYDFERRINESVFPGFQGGPHNHTIAGLAVALKMAMLPEFKTYQQAVVRNCKALSDRLIERGYNIVSGGTDNHLILVDLKKDKIDGARVERVLELSNVALNKNTVPGDKSALQPGGIRLGTPAMTTRGLNEKDFTQVADFIHEGIQIAINVKNQTKLMTGFRDALDNDPTGFGIGDLRKRVEEFSDQFPAIAQ